MSASILETIRANHEQVEKLEIAFEEELNRNPSGQKGKVFQQHKLLEIATRISAANKELERLYVDRDGLLQEEIGIMRGSSMLNSFYEKVASSKEYFQKSGVLDSLFDVSDEINPSVMFSGEEVFGKYLDLHQLHLQFSNLLKKYSIEQDYLQYLDRFNSFFYLPDGLRASGLYCEYLDALWNYLSDFFHRINPIADLASLTGDWLTEFESRFGSAKVSSIPQEYQPLRLGMFNNVDELEALGAERLKEALLALELKCGGTLKDRAQRLWSVRGKKPEEIPIQLKSKPKGGQETKHAESVRWKEYRVECLCELLNEVVVATRRHAEKQQTRSAEEKEQELYDEEFGTEQLTSEAAKTTEEDDDDEPIYNPLNIPLGWDGKPIPYWLYKLHGLGVEYKCEICGNQSYWGRRAFERHFQEWKHSYGMKCLGVPNSKHFHDITSIEEVLALYSKIKDTLHFDQFMGDLEEEFEDTEGNVLDRRTYEDLARQGLL